MKINRKLTALAAATSIAAAGVTTAVYASSPEAKVVPGNQVALGAGPAPDGTTAAQKNILQAGADAYGLVASQARSARPAGASATSAPWVITPGTDGVCVATYDGVAGCAPNAAFDSGGFFVQTLPKVQTAVPKPGSMTAPITIGKGTTTIRGVVPVGFVAAIAYDSTGNEIGRARIQQNVYDLTADAQQLATVKLVRSDGSATQILEN